MSGYPSTAAMYPHYERFLGKHAGNGPRKGKTDQRGNRAHLFITFVVAVSSTRSTVKIHIRFIDILPSTSSSRIIQYINQQNCYCRTAVSHTHTVSSNPEFPFDFSFLVDLFIFPARETFRCEPFQISKRNNDICFQFPSRR